MNGALQPASPFLDEPWRRFAWIAPLSLAIWFALLLGFAMLLKQTAPPLAGAQTHRRADRRIASGGRWSAGWPRRRAASRRPGAAKTQAACRSAAQSHRAGASAQGAARAGNSAVAIGHAESARRVEHYGIQDGDGPEYRERRRVSGKGRASGGSGLGSDSLGARAIYSPVPTIPDDLRDVAFQAVAVAHFEVSYDGNVKVTLVKPTPDPRLNQILLSTLEQWRFFPAMKGGVAIDSAFDVRIPISVQ